MKLPWSPQPDAKAPTSDAADSLDSEDLTLCGTAWCDNCYRTCRFLDRRQLSYYWTDANAYPEVNEISEMVNQGRRSMSTRNFSDGSAAPIGVVAAAGLHVSQIDGSKIAYNQPNAWLPDPLVCRPELADRGLAAIAAGQST